MKTSKLERIVNNLPIDFVNNRYETYLFPNTNSVIFQWRNECMAYHMNGSRIPLPEELYLFPKSAYRDRLMKFEDLSIQSQPILVDLDGMKDPSRETGRKGIMTTDCQVIIPAICSRIEMKDYFGITIVIDEAVAFWGKLWAEENAGLWPIRIPYNDNTYLGFAFSTERVLNKDASRTWQKVVASIVKFLDNVPSAYITSEEESINFVLNGVYSQVKYFGAGIIEDELEQFEKEMKRVISKHKLNT